MSHPSTMSEGPALKPEDYLRAKAEESVEASPIMVPVTPHVIGTATPR